MLVSVIMPCLNEEGAIGRVIDQIPVKDLREKGFDVEILVVDGGSTDKSVEIAGQKGAGLLFSERGYGKQYRMGFNHAKGDIIVAADSDGSYPLADAGYYIEALEKQGLDFISINRFGTMFPRSMPAVNAVGNHLLTWTMNVLFVLDLKDSQSGMWIFRRHVLDDAQLSSNGMPLSQEIKLHSFSRYRSREMDGGYEKRIGRPKLRRFRDGMDNVMFLLKKYMEERWR